jgi:spore coat protein CotF
MNHFLRYIVEASACLALFYLVYWLFLKKETYFHLNRIYLVSALLLAFIIPGLNVASPFFTASARSAATSFSHGQAVPAPSIGLAEIIVGSYIAGVVLFFIRFVFHLAKLYAVVKRHGIWKSHNIRIVSVDREFAPFSFLNVVFLNARNIGDVDLERILAHEKVHIQQGHSLDVLLMELVIILQWFNPFVWPYKKSLQETHEYLADSGVIAQGFSAAAYELLVFEQHVGAQLFEFANNFKQSQIKRRLTMMSKIKSKNAAKLKLLFVLPLAALLVLAFANPKPARSSEHAAAPAVQEKAGQEWQVSKEKVAQAKEELKMLKNKEEKIRQMLATTEDPEKKKELKKSLETVLVKEQEMTSFLKNAGAAPPLPANGDELKAEYKALLSKEAKIKEELANTESPEKKAELKALLQKVTAKKADIQSMMEGNGPASEPTIEDLKKEYMSLDQKGEQVRAELAKTTDPNQKAKLEDTLKKIAQKQEMIKAKAQEIKKAQEEKKQ